MHRQTPYAATHAPAAPKPSAPAAPELPSSRRTPPQNEHREAQRNYERMLEEGRAQQAQVAELKAQLAQARAVAAEAVAAGPPPVSLLASALPPPRATSPEDSLWLSLRLLAGSNANLAQCVALALISLACALSAVGILGGASGAAGVRAIDRAYYVLAILLLAAGVLQLSRTVRDRRLAEVFPNEMLTRQLVGTSASAVMTLLSMVVSLALAVTVVVGMSAESGLSVGESVGLMLLAISFLLTSLVNLAKAWRDRFDAAFFEAAFKRSPERLNEFIAAVHLIEASSDLFYFINTSAAFASTAAIFVAIFAGGSLSTEFKIILAICEIFMISSAVNMSKLVRDNIEAGAIKPSFQWAAVTATAMVAALVAVFGVEVAVCTSNSISPRFCALLFIGTFWVLGSVITLSKITRDRDEKRRSAAAQASQITRGVQDMHAEAARSEAARSEAAMYASEAKPGARTNPMLARRGDVAIRI